MNTRLNISLDTGTLALVTASLKNGELARLMRALAACACGEDGEQYLNTSGLRIAFALLSPPIAQSVKRVTTLRANGAKGGRPRRNQPPVVSPVGDNDSENAEISENFGFPLVSAKKSKKEDLPPTPELHPKS